MTNSSYPQVIDLTTGSTVQVRVARDGDLLATLTPAERQRLYIRVLCELVAYGETESSEIGIDAVPVAVTAASPNSG